MVATRGLRLDVAPIPEGAVLSLGGEVDGYTAAQLRDELRALIDEPGTNVVIVDLADMGFIDSSGLGVLAGAHRRLRSKGGELRLRSPSPATYKVLEVAGFLRLIPVEEPVTDDGGG